MTFDRSKFKATRAVELKQDDKRTESTVRNRTASADYLDIPEKAVKAAKGTKTYTMRIFPYHPEGGGRLFAEAKVVHWLKVMLPKRDSEGKVETDNKGKEILELKSKPIFNSRIHAGTPKDIIEEYIKFAEKVAKENYPSNEANQKAYLEPIYGGFNSKFDGLMARQSWVAYAYSLNSDGSKDFGRWEIGKAVKDRLNKISAIEGANDPLGTDPFTDLAEGRYVKVTYNGSATKSQDYYTTELDTSFDKKSGKVNFAPLSDADLEKFMACPSLHKMFVDVYKMKDYDMAIDGLNHFDSQAYEVKIDGKSEKITYGLFGYEEFLNTCEEISNYYAVEGVETTGEVQEEEEEETSDAVDVKEDDENPFLEMDREELIEWARDNRTGIVITKKMTDDAVREKLNTWNIQNMTPGFDGVEGKEETGTKKTVASIKANAKSGKAKEDETEGDLPWQGGKEKVKIEGAVKTGAGVSDRVAQIRANLAKNKGK